MSDQHQQPQPQPQSACSDAPQQFPHPPPFYPLPQHGFVQQQYFYPPPLSDPAATNVSVFASSSAQSVQCFQQSGAPSNPPFNQALFVSSPVAVLPPTVSDQTQVISPDEVLPPSSEEQNSPNVIIHFSSLGGALTNEGGRYATFEIKMRGILPCFGGRTQPWNQGYENAVRIFSKKLTSKAIRASIHVEYATLYREGSKKQTTTTTSKDGASFIQLVTRGEKIPMKYTYVIAEDGFLRFSQTGSGKMKDFMSKHAMHANVARQVVYAGEFFFRFSPITYLVIDNNSGTYSPKKELLSNVADLFRINFPGLFVEALDYQDPRLLEYTRSL